MKATNNTIINPIMSKYMRMICAVLMVLGVSTSAWGADPAAPSANYTLIKSVGSLSTNDRVILYCPTTETAVSGLSTCNSSTEARMSSSSQEWVEYKVTVVDASTIKLQDTRIGSNNYVYNNSNKFQYAGSGSATALSITSAGIINAGGTNLNAKTVGTGTCERASARFASGGSNVYVFKVASPKESKYYVTASSAELSITIDDDNGDDYGTYYSSSALVTVYTTAAFSGRINAELSGFTHCNFTDFYIVAVNDDNDENNFIINTANSNEGIYVRSWSLGWDNLQTGVYSGYIHVYPATGTNTTDEFYIPLTVTITNGSGSDVCATCDANPTVGAASLNGTISSNTSVAVRCTSVSVGSNCEWEDYGFVWGTATAPTIGGSGCTKVQVGTSGSVTSFTGSLTSTFTTGTTYYYRAYGKNRKDGAAFVYSSSTSSFIIRSITFNSNGGSAVATKYVESGTTATAPTAPTKTGYTFGGWYQEAELTNAVNWSSTITANKIYYAKWTAKDISLTLNKNNSDVSGSSNGSASVKYDATSLTSISHATRTGYSLEGYYAEAGCTNKVLTSAGALVNYTGYVVSNKWARATTPTTLYAKWTAITYTDYRFSCSELTLEAHPETAGAPIFITSVAEKKVRSQGYITISGSGLTPSTTLTFPGLDSKFEIKTASGGAISTDENGEIDDVDAYIFYTPGVGDTDDGLDKLAGITVSVGGAKPKQASLVQSIIGRHLPTAGYVIAGKKDGKWYALPSNMASTSTPAPSEIAVDDFNNPSVAYTDASNIYGLEGPTTSGGGNNIASGYGQYVRLTMSINDGNEPAGPAPLFGSSSTAPIGKSDNAKATSNLSAGYWWELKQTNTSITNPQDAKYTIKCANNSSTLSIKNSPFQWGLYASGVEELRLIPASNIIFTEAYFVEWGQHGGIIEVDAGATGINATSVVAHLGENSSSATLTNAGTSGKPATTTKYNYIVDFGNDIDFAAAASNGALLTLEWKNGETVKAMTSLVVPKIIAANGAMKSIMSGDAQWETEVHVLPGVTLEANAGDFESNDVMIKHLEIYPGATVVVTKGSQASGTLKVKTLVLRNGWKRIGGKAYDVARLYITPTTASLAKNAGDDVWYSEWYIDFDQYYPIAVPWPVTVANMSYKNSKTAVSVGPSGTMRLRYYDGNSRATNIQEGVGSGANWKQFGEAGNTAVPSTLDPSKGYAMTAKRPTGKAFSIIRMPLTVTNAWTSGGEQGSVEDDHKDQVTVTAYGVKEDSQTAYAEGWNFIANPYMSLHQGALSYTDEGNVMYANIPDINFKEYDQVPIASTKLKPSSGFLIQAPKTGTVTFRTANRKPSAPSFRREVQEEKIPEQQAFIVLSDESNEDMMGLLVADKYTEAYEVNADLEKLLGDGTSLKTYMYYGDRNMAYVAINETLAQEWIPVTVRVPSTGEYTFSMHEASIAAELEGVYLIDYENGSKVTNLINENYIFTADAGTISNRFAINAIIGERKTPTDIDIVHEGGDIRSNMPFKFIYRENVYIYHRGIIYDATGKKVREINK